MTLKRYAPDTNFYLHAKAADQLPWGELTAADTIELVVLDEVLKELDGHKAGGNGRRARKARNAFTLLDPLIDDDQQEVVARQAGPRVVWRLAPVLPGNRDKPADLDLDTPDGRIVEQALAVRQVLGGDLALLSHDRLPRRLARIVNLESQRLPDSWLLEPEPDERDKENAKLKEDLKAWSNRAPQIELELLDGEEAVERIQGPLVRYRPLPHSFVADAVEVIERRYPEETPEQPSTVTVYRADMVAKYASDRHKWLGDVQRSVEKQPARLTFIEGVRELDLVIDNAGSAPAEGLVMEVTVEGALKLVNHHKRKEFLPHFDRFGFPAPPKMQRMSSLFTDPFKIDNRDLMRNLDYIKPPPMARDPGAFYWDYDEDAIFCSGATGTCGDFRHQMGNVDLPIILALPMEHEGDPVGCLRIRCSAKNLPKPIEWTFPIRLETEWRDCEERVKQLIHDYGSD